MATREENLKRINAELEELTDEELEQLAGGTATGITLEQIIKEAQRIFHGPI